MGKENIYWVLAALLGGVQLHTALLYLPFSVPVYASALAAAGLGLWLYRRKIFHAGGLNISWHVFLTLLQAAAVSLSFADLPVVLCAVPFTLSAGIEAIRVGTANKLYSLKRELLDFEEQRTHSNETFRLIRSERHDFLKHVSALQFLLEHEKHEEARIYLDDLIGGYEETNLSIKGERGIIAGMLHQQYKRGNQSGISIVYDLDLPLSALPLPDQDIIGLVGNLLANSIDAAEEWQNLRQKTAEISIQFYRKSGLYLLTVKNSSAPLPVKLVDQLFEAHGLTTKSGNHQGLGTKIIKDIVRKHGGYLDFVHKNEEFTVKIKIPALTGGLN